MIASPSDVPQERVVVRDVIAEWNAIHAKDRNTVLMPVGWETHATPHIGDRPQALINGQVLKDADLLVAVFWTRLGSPTGVAPSGTVEEIEEHIKAEKPAMIYFSLAPAHPDSIISEQYTALKKFKESLASRGLYSEYETLSSFKEMFSRHLAQTIISKFPSTGTAPAIAVGVAAGVATAIGAGNTNPILPALTPEARQLLLEASSDSQGAIMSVQTMDGLSVQTNGRSFAEQGNSRSEALWRGAVEELSNAGLVEDRRGKREVYFVTDKGYRVSDLL